MLFLLQFGNYLAKISNAANCPLQLFYQTIALLNLHRIHQVFLVPTVGGR